MANDVTHLWSSLRDLFESSDLSTPVETCHTEVVAASVTLLVKQGGTVTLKNFFFPPKDEK